MTRVVVHPRRRASGYDAVVTIDPAPRAGRQDLAATAIARARLAGDDDNAAILELMADVPMEGNLALATQRGPDFFALYRLQRGQHFLFVDEAKDNSGRLAGMGGILVRSGWLDGVTMPVGYLGDLRTRGFVRERVAFPQVYAHFFHQTAQQTGCDHYLTAILADNAAAARALTEPSTLLSAVTTRTEPARAERSQPVLVNTDSAPARTTTTTTTTTATTTTTTTARATKRRPQPHYHLLTPYEMANIHFLRRRRAPPTPGLTVRRATTTDLPRITALLAADHKRRPFGWRFDTGEFEHRLVHWPGFRIENTFIVVDDRDVLRAVTTCWDPHAVKRYAVLRYGGQMLWVKRALSLAARVTGTAPLPKIGDDFRSFYLTNLSVKDDDPRVFQALVDAVYAAHVDDGYHFFSFPLYPNDALAGGTAGYFVRKVPFLLYAVTSSSVRRTAWPAGRPGFEMALA